MKEHSQIDDMRAAIRGEWERAGKDPRPSALIQPPDDDLRDRLQAVPEPEDEPRTGSGRLARLFKRR